MVRFCDLRVLCCADRPSILPAGGRGCAATLSLWRVRDRLSDAASRRRARRPYRRHRRTACRTHLLRCCYGGPDVSNWPLAELSGDRCPCAYWLILLRVVQGLSVGGEYTGSLVFLVEHA